MSLTKKLRKLIYIVLLIGVSLLMPKVLAQLASSPINEIVVSPTGDYIAVGHSNGQIILIDTNTWIEILLRPGDTEFVSASGVTSFAWHPGGDLLAAGDAKGAIEVWDIGTQQIVTSFAGRYSAVTGLDWLSDGSQLLAGYSEEAAVVWDVASGDLILEILVGQAHSVALNPNDNTFVVGGIRNFSIWDVTTGQNILKIETGNFESNTVWNSGGDKFFSWSVGIGNDYLSLDIRDGTTGLLIQSLSVPDNVPVGGILEAGWSPDDRLIFTGSMLGYINVWDSETGLYIDTIEYNGQIGGLDILPDGSQFVFGGLPNNGQPSTVQYAPVPNQPPTADAGPDLTVTAADGISAKVTLDGSGSTGDHVGIVSIERCASIVRSPQHDGLVIRVGTSENALPIFHPGD
jgi:WD40 repeat protein